MRPVGPRYRGAEPPPPRKVLKDIARPERRKSWPAPGKPIRDVCLSYGKQASPPAVCVGLRRKKPQGEERLHGSRGLDLKVAAEVKSNPGHAHQHTRGAPCIRALLTHTHRQTCVSKTVTAHAYRTPTKTNALPRPGGARGPAARPRAALSPALSPSPRSPSVQCYRVKIALAVEDEKSTVMCSPAPPSRALVRSAVQSCDLQAAGGGGAAAAAPQDAGPRRRPDHQGPRRRRAGPEGR